MSDIGAETDSLGTGEEGSAAGSPATKKKHRQPKKKTLARLKAMKKNAMGSSESLGNSSQADSERGNEGKEEEKSEVKPDPKDSTSKETGEKDPENSDESKPKPKPRRRFKELAQSGDEADRNSLSDFEGKHSPRPPSKPKPTTRRFGSTDSLKSSSSVDVENKSQGLNLPKKTASESSTDSAVTRSPRPGQWRGPIEPKVKETKPTAVALSDYSSDDGVETKKDEKRRKDKEQKGSNSTGNTSKERDSPGKSTTPAGSENKGNQDAKQVIGGSSSTGSGVPSGSSSDDDVVISTGKPKSDKGHSETKEQKTESNVSSPKLSHVNDRTGGVSDKVEMNRAKDSDDSDGSIPDMVPELEARLTAKLKMEDKGPKTSTPLKRQSSSLTSDTSSLVSVTSESSSEEDDLFLTNHKPGLNRLEPLKGAPNLPPIEGNASSQSLRTTIKTEFPVYSLYHGERSNSMPGLNAGHQLSRTESDMSVMSFQSVSALPMIQTRAARDRSYLLGSSMSSGALLGQDELERYFPDRRMTIFVGTWNMHGEKDLPEKIDDFLLPECCEYVQDMYIMGFQEGTPTRREWEIRMQETLGPTHVLFYSGTYGVLHLCVFIRRDLIWFCSVAEEDTVSTRAFSQIKTKGGLAVSFSFFGTTFLFINSHFTSGDNKAKERIADYSKICEAISLPKIIPVNQHSTDPSSEEDKKTRKWTPKTKQKKSDKRVAVAPTDDCTSRFDCVFWFGDMNFRLDHERSKVEELIKHGHKSDYKELVAHDQLTNFMKKDEAFVGFKESQIRFPPTYKFDLNTDHYDTSPKLRVPSYTDRVLYKCKKAGDITPMHYSNVPSIKISDHRPVYSVFEVKIRPGRDTIPLAAGQFDREVYIEANRRRAMQINVERKQSRICSIM